jgi:hypothetical protein
VIDSKLLCALDPFRGRLGRTIILGDGDHADAHTVLRKPVEFDSLVETVAACVK